MRQPNLIILAGPNGSGKSTLFQLRLAKWGLPFVNPDVIAKEIAPEDPENAALKAARVADERRKALLEIRQGFVTEGIRPDLRLIREARERGYFVRVVFICLESPGMNIARVMLRVSKGGHMVPLEAIRARYARALDSLPGAAEEADQLLLFDNSRRTTSPRLIARFDRGGQVKSLRREQPAWARQVFQAEFDRFRANVPRA